jgi:hypothetical protein
MMDERPLGIVVALLGAVGTAIAALADPLGIGEGEIFGWLQITGVIIGAIVTLLGLAMSMEWVPYPGRTRAATATDAQQNTTIIEDSPPPARTDNTTVVETPPRDRTP